MFKKDRIGYMRYMSPPCETCSIVIRDVSKSVVVLRIQSGQASEFRMVIVATIAIPAEGVGIVRLCRFSERTAPTLCPEP